MIKKIPIVIFLFIILLYSTVVYAEGFKYVEIFDPKQNKVVKVVQVNEELHNVVANWIKNINGIYGKNDPLTDDGYAIKIPLDPAVKVRGKSLNALVNVVYIIIPENDPPFFMIFEDENKLCCFPFNGNIDMLSKSLDFKLKTNR
ncbi:hypothetical protein [Clostridium thailandense]|uniref:hypothetical protein n=1 Tax=Clostridium thailandense TaxID=2794346 RepID=UPI003989E8C1